MVANKSSEVRSDETNLTLAKDILCSSEIAKNIDVGETRCIRHEKARLLSRVPLPWVVQLDDDKAFRVKGMVLADGVWVTRDA